MYTDQTVYEEVVSKWRERTPRGLAVGIDDMQNRSMRGFDLVVNTEIGLERACYAAKESLLGERYALLRSGFSSPSRLVGAPVVEPGQVPVLVMIGGTDPFGYTQGILEVLLALGEKTFIPVVVASDSAVIEGVLRRFSCSRFLTGVGAAELAAWMRFCSFGILACGTSLYEAAAMNLPFVGLSVVDNQSATARKVEENWGMPVVSLEKGTFDAGAFSDFLRKVNARDRKVYSKTDTEGAERVAQKLEVLCS